MVISNVSFFGQTQATSSRLRELNTTMWDLQRQLTTQKKTDTFSGLGFSSLTVQSYRMNSNHLSSYIENINKATTRIQMMNNSLESAIGQARDLLSALQSQFRQDPIDMSTIQQISGQSLDFMESIVNLELDGRYLFSGSSSGSRPITTAAAATSLIEDQIDDLYDGTQNVTQFLANIAALTPTQLGFNPALTSAGSVSVRVDEATEVDHTSIASTNGFQDLMLALQIASKLEVPDPAVDIATQDDFADVLDNLMTITKNSLTALESEATRLGGKYEFLGTLKTSHEQEKAMLEILLSKEENIDTAEVSLKISVLQTQMNASYEVTSLVSQLSLVNYL